jgi:predicted dehydrogenase
MAARLDDEYELVAGALSSTPERSHASAAAVHIDPSRSYDDFHAMARAEAAREDGIDVVSIVTPNHVHHPAAAAFLDAGISVICDKPLTRTLAEAEDLQARQRRSGLIFAVTYNYTGYPMVRQAREMVAGGALGTIRTVQVEYAQEWLVEALEETGQKQAAWRTDPTRSGAGGCIGDIGTHAFNLAEFVTGLRCAELAADLNSFVPGRRLDDNAQMMLRFQGGARGMLWASQVAPGSANGLRLRVYGSGGSLGWQQEMPERLVFTQLGAAPSLLSRGGPGAGASAAHATRIPAGHPEGYLEAFAQIYRDTAAQLRARMLGRDPGEASRLVPDITQGVRGVAFVAAAIASNAANGAWQPVPP